jgi:hypothetical protein
LPKWVAPAGCDHESRGITDLEVAPAGRDFQFRVNEIPQGQVVLWSGQKNGNFDLDCGGDFAYSNANDLLPIHAVDERAAKS